MATGPQSPESGGASLVGVILIVAALVAVAITGTLAIRTLDTAEAATDVDADGRDPRAGDPGAGDPGAGDPGPGVAAPATSAPTTTTTTPPTTTTTTTTTPPAPEPTSLRIGSEGDDVVALQQRLRELGFHVPDVDGRYGGLTQQAVMAFQKAAGIGRDGIAGPATLGALETGSPVQAREGGDHIEVDLARQLMIVVRGGETFVFNTSTGRAGWRTPSGRFTVTRQIDGVRHAPLGELYRPKYFNAGIALHGSPSIPGHPASHGCTRLHDDVIDLIWSADLAPIGTPVWVY